MFSKPIVLLYAVCVLFACAGESSERCYPHPDHTVIKIRQTTCTQSWISGLLNGQIQRGINQQIKNDLSAHYTYLSMAYHFDQSEFYLPGFSKFFKKMSEEEHEHAQKFMKYLNKRGGQISLHKIPEPCDDKNWGNGTNAMKKAWSLERLIYDSLIALRTVGDNCKDPQFVDFVESEFLAKQIDSIKQITDYVHVLERLDSPLGELIFDKLTLGGDKE